MGTNSIAARFKAFDESLDTRKVSLRMALSLLVVGFASATVARPVIDVILNWFLGGV